MIGQRLTVPEELLLLGWNDEWGLNLTTQNLTMLLGGATVLELALREAVTIEDQLLHATGARTGHPTLDLALDTIAGSRKSRTVKAWVQRWGQRRWVRTTVLDRLVDRGILRRDTRRILGLVPVSRHPVVDRAQTTELRRHAGQVLTDPDPVSDPRDAALGGLVHSAGPMLLRRLVPSEARRGARQRAKALSKGEAVNADVAKAVSEVNAAAMAAVAAGGAASSGGG